MERAERLLDLVALFLNAREAVSWADIQEAFPADYAAGSAEANIRKFERDKADLAELGISLVYVQGEERDKDGYLLDRGGYYLPELSLAPDELAVLYAAGAAALAEAAFPFREDLAHALKKMAFAAGDEPGVGRSWGRTAPLREAPEEGQGDGTSPLAQHVALLSRAVATRKRVKLRYRSLGRGQVSDREVDPYGLVYRFGRWSLAGYCHLRKGQRVFRVDRILKLDLNESRPRTPDFELPADFSLDAIAAARPWEFGGRAPFEARLRLAPELAFLAERSFAGSQVVERSKRGVVLALPVSDGEAFLRAVLPLGEGAEIIGPPALRQRARSLLEDLLARHEAGEPPVAARKRRRA
ncbi:MAG: helix-turn-helix transcriptional regulator [Myxococcales bacterium]